MYDQIEVHRTIPPVFLVSGIILDCIGGFSSEKGRTITIAVVENNFGTSGNPDPRFIYEGVKLATGQMNERGYDVRMVPHADENDPAVAE